MSISVWDIGQGKISWPIHHLIYHWIYGTPQTWPRPGGSFTVALRRTPDHDGTVTVDISWTSSPAKGYHDRTRREYDMTMNPETEKYPVVATEPPRGSEEHDPRPAPRRYPSRKSNIPPPRRGQAPPNRLPTILYRTLILGLVSLSPVPSLPVSTEPFYRPRDPSNNYCSPRATWPWPRCPRKEGVRCTFNNIAAPNHFPIHPIMSHNHLVQQKHPPLSLKAKGEKKVGRNPTAALRLPNLGENCPGHVRVCVWRFTGRLGMIFPHSTHSSLDPAPARSSHVCRPARRKSSVRWAARRAPHARPAPCRCASSRPGCQVRLGPLSPLLPSHACQPNMYPRKK
ncbi:hypothetical protein CPAR01_02562 [Colletotrichum paranaense]|uniref:Uncharacterized protein n=1 Tax=Colletotrichum paranaense TaxID=1914294 RepID=A0ABQ9T0F0_9PEZI|nr:uncharacterized protein CPAR01_02562 [Colletotrichum paranaense]KAK1545060.1 hypothetical protein CPAR01_02562 [Colletotrichum paranaense]